MKDAGQELRLAEQGAHGAKRRRAFLGEGKARARAPGDAAGGHARHTRRRISRGPAVEGLGGHCARKGGRTRS